MTETPSIEIELDNVANCAYVTLNDHGVARTVELTPEVMVDLDEMGIVVGIEVLAMDASIPLDRLEAEFHVHSDVVAMIHLIRPNVQAFTLRVTSADDGVVASSAPPLALTAC